MKLYQLQYFREVCLMNGITKAAESLHVSQPAVSNAIKELEEEFQIKLFKRINKKLILTEEGAYFLLEVENLLEQSDQIIRNMSRMRDKKQSVRLGLPPMIGAMSVDMICAFKKKYPDINIDLHDGSSLTLRKMLREDQVDIIIVSGRNKDLENSEGCILKTSEMVFCVNEGHHLSAEKSISIAHAALEPLVTVKDSFFVREKILNRFAENNCTARLEWTTDQLHTKIEIIRSGLASGFLLREIAEQEYGIAGIFINPPIEVDIEMSWLKNGVFYKNINCFIEFAKEYYKVNEIRSGNR